MADEDPADHPDRRIPPGNVLGPDRRGRGVHLAAVQGHPTPGPVQQAPLAAGIEPHLKDFEALTGIKLVAEVYPEDQFRAKTLVELTSGASSIDVFMTMPAQDGLKYVRAGWLQPVDEFLKDPALTAPDFAWTDFLAGTGMR